MVANELWSGRESIGTLNAIVVDEARLSRDCADDDMQLFVCLVDGHNILTRLPNDLHVLNR